MHRNFFVHRRDKAGNNNRIGYLRLSYNLPKEQAMEDVKNSLAAKYPNLTGNVTVSIEPPYKGDSILHTLTLGETEAANNA